MGIEYSHTTTTTPLPRPRPPCPGFGAQDATALQRPVLCLSFLNCKMGITADPSLQGMMEIKLGDLYKQLEPGNLIFDSLLVTGLSLGHGIPNNPGTPSGATSHGLGGAQGYACALAGPPR